MAKINIDFICWEPEILWKERKSDCEKQRVINIDSLIGLADINNDNIRYKSR